MGQAEVVVVTRDGDVELVSGTWVATQPSFSPDCRSLVVVRAEGDYESAGPASTSLSILDTAGTNRRALTRGPNDDDPAWSPDGELIAFSRETAGTSGLGSHLAVVRPEGGEVQPVTPNAGSIDRAPAWSPDGRELAFIRTQPEPSESRSTTIWIVGADGTSARQLTVARDAHSVQWHPDGETLLVSTFAAEDGTVMLVDVDSGNATQVAEHATFATWSRTGDEVYYFDKEGAPEPSWWRLALGRLVGGRLERTRYVGEIEDYLYPYFGLASSPCA